MFVPLQGQDIELNNLIRTRMGLNTRSVSAETYYQGRQPDPKKPGILD